MIYKLTKHFNSFTHPSTAKEQKGKNSSVASSAVNNHKWNTYTKANHFIGLESQINSVIYSCLKKVYIITSKPIYCINNKEITVKFLYFIPDNLLSTNVPASFLKDPNFKRSYLAPATPTVLPQPLKVGMLGRDAGSIVISRIQFLSMLLSKWLNINVKVEATRVKHPQFDSNIFAEYLGIKSFSWSYSKMKKAVRVLSIKSPSLSLPSDQPSPALAGNRQKAEGGDGITATIAAADKQDATRVAVPFRFMSGLTGLSLKVSGRLQKQRIVPKRTVKRTHKGPSAASSMMTVQTATFTGKNKKGSYSIKVQTGHSLRS